ncbi:MAG: hypothetical protein ACE5EH_06200 [Gammaproteobacteria bacterium]
MGAINLEDLKPGMVLAEDATQLNGRVLLRAGTELTEKHIKVFKTWGVTEANIEGVSKESVANEELEQLSPEILKDAEDKTRHLFRHCDLENPVSAELYRLCVMARAGNKVKSAE